MRTRKAISNISYNTIPFLKAKLEYLENKGKIENWFFIPHKAEFNEDIQANKKDHIHLYIKPAVFLQTMELTDEFKEVDPAKDKPLGVLKEWQICNSFGDLWLYFIHNPYYLMHKGITREFNYSIDDVICSDRDTLERLVSFIDLASMFRLERIYEAAQSGLTFSQAYAQGILGENPQRYVNVYSTLRKEYLEEQNKKLEEERDHYIELNKALQKKIKEAL